VLRCFFAAGERPRRHAPLLVALRPYAPAAADLHFEPLAQSIDYRHADAMEAAGDLVGRVLELAPGMQDRQHHLGRRLAALFVRIDGNPAAVVPYRAGPVRVEDHLDAVAVAG